MYKLWPGQALSIPSFDLQVWPWPSTYLNKFFQMILLLLKDNNCAKLFWNWCINVEVMARTSSIYDPFIKFDLNLQPTCTNVSNGTSTPQGEQLWQIVLKSMHTYTSFGPNKSWRMYAHSMHAHDALNSKFYVLLTASWLDKNWCRSLGILMRTCYF